MNGTIGMELSLCHDNRVFVGCQPARVTFLLHRGDPTCQKFMD